MSIYYDRSKTVEHCENELQPLSSHRLTEPLTENPESQINEHRSWWDRSFSRMHPGSQRGSILTLIAASVGAGVLTLPYVCNMTGLCIGIMLITLGMLASFWSLHNLIFASEKFGTKRYLHMCKLAGGDYLGYLYEISICIQQCGCLLGYQIISGTIVTKALIDFRYYTESQLAQNAAFNSLKIILPAIFISFPLCRQHQMTNLRYPSLFAVLAIIFAIFVVIWNSVYAITWDNLNNKISYAKFDMHFFQACGVTFFAYICQPSFCPIYSDLANPTVQRISTVVFRATITEYVLYIGISICGYLSFGDNTLPVIINNNAMNTFFQVLFNIARLMVYIKLAISIPVNFNPLRRTIYDLVYGEHAELEEPKYF